MVKFPFRNFICFVFVNEYKVKYKLLKLSIIPTATLQIYTKSTKIKPHYKKTVQKSQFRKTKQLSSETKNVNGQEQIVDIYKTQHRKLKD